MFLYIVLHLGCVANADAKIINFGVIDNIYASKLRFFI